ncbi:hypothetical protein AAK938_03205 [Aerococcaceae bacterium 50-4]
MRRTLTQREKMYTVLLVIAFTVITILMSIFFVGNQFSRIANDDIMPVVTVMVAIVVVLMGISISGAIVHILVQLTKPKQDVSIGFTYYIFLIVNLVVSLFTFIVMVIVGAKQYLVYEEIFGYFTGLLSHILMAYLFYRYDIFTKKNAIKLVVYLIILGVISTAISSLFGG